MGRAYVSPLRDEQLEATRLRIVEAVARVLARGVVELSVPAVAKEAGVSVATVYRHFSNKAELVRGLAAHASRFQGTGFSDRLESLDDLEAKWRDILQRRAKLEPAIRQAMASPEWNRLRVATRKRRLAGAEKMLAALTAHLAPRERRRARDMFVLLGSSATVSAYELLIGSSPEEAAATFTWAIKRIVSSDGQAK